MCLMTQPFGDREAIEGEVFENLDLMGALLEERELTDCTFRNCKLGESTWKRMRLEACRFESCDLTRASLATAKAHGLTFTSCKLMGIDFSQLAAAHDLVFVDSNLRYSSFVDMKLRKLSVTRCSVIDANFVAVDLANAVFEECELTNTVFTRCELKGARFPHARGLYLDPRTNNVKGVKVPLETAVLLAQSFDMSVIGYD